MKNQDLDTKDLNILERIGIVMGRRQAIDTFIFTILIMGFLISISSKNAKNGFIIFTISLILALLIGYFRKKLYKFL